MLLAIDLGNTNTVLGLFDGDVLAAQWRLTTLHERTVDEYAVLFHSLFQLHGKMVNWVSDVIICSVVPPSLPWIVAAVRQTFQLEPIIVDPPTAGGMPIRYVNPAEVGADRIVNAIAAYHEFGGPLVIIDFGTATTFCAVSAAGEYLGGAIAPGVKISTDALFRATAKLPRVSIEPMKSVIGDTTVTSIQAGVFYGYLGLIEGIVSRMIRELSYPTKVIATGGLAALFAPSLPFIDVVDPHLTLKGLRLIHHKHR